MRCTNAEQTAVWKKLEDGTYVYEHCAKGEEGMKGDLTFTYLNNVELRMVSDDGIKFLIDENSAKIKVLEEQNKRLREELSRRANDEEEK